MILSQKNDSNTFPTSPNFTSRAYFYLALPLIMISFYVIDHSWDASAYIDIVFELYDGSENRTADRTENVNGGSSTCRLILAAFGLAGLVLHAPVRSRITPLLMSMVAYYGWLYCSLLWSSEPQSTAYKLTVVAVFLTAALGISKQLSLQQLACCFATICGLYLGLGVIAEIYYGQFQIANREYRFTGTTHPNTSSIYAATVCLYASLTCFGDRKARSWNWIIAFLIGLLFMFLTKSRTSLAAMILALTAMGTVQVRPRLRTPLVAGVLTMITIGVITLAFVDNQLRGKLGTAAAMGRDDDVTTLTGRLPLWEELIDSISESPIIGHGYLAFWTNENIEYLSDLLKWEIPHGHNLYLDILLDGGVVGLMLFIAMIGIGLATAIRKFSNSRDPGAAFAIGLITLTIVHGFGESLFKLPVYPSFMLITLLLRLTWEPNPTGKAESDSSLSNRSRQLVGRVGP